MSGGVDLISTATKTVAIHGQNSGAKKSSSQLIFQDAFKVMLSDGEQSNYFDSSDEEILVNAEKLMKNNLAFGSVNFLDKISESVNSPTNA